MKKILLLGSTGFIGRNLIDTFQGDSQYTLITPPRSELNLENREETISYFKKHQPQIVINAAYIGVNSSIPYSNEYLYSNLQIVTDILEASKNITSIEKIIFFGSSLEYTDIDRPITESDILDPKNTYATTKSLCSMLSLSLAKQWNLPLILLRPFNLYGKYDTKSVIFYITKAITEDKKLTLTNGEQIRDYLYMNDFNIIFKSILKNLDKFKDGEVFNIGTGKPTQLKDMFHAIFKSLGRRPDYDIKNLPPNEYMHNVANLEKLKSILSLKKPTDLETGIKESVSWITNHLKND